MNRWSRSVAITPVLLISTGIFGCIFNPSSAKAIAINPQMNIPLNNGTQGDLRNQADTLLQIGGQEDRRGNLDKALTYWLQALNIYKQIGDDEAIGLTYDFIGLTYGRLGRYREAEDALRRRLGVARDRQDFQGQIYGLNNLGTVLLQGAKIPSAQAAFIEALTIARSVKNFAGEGLSLSNIGLVTAGLGDHFQAIKQYEAALSLRRNTGDVLGEANTLNNLGDAYRAINQYQYALRAYRESLLLSQSIRDPRNQFRALDGLVTVYGAVGSYPQAFQALNLRLNLAQENQNRYQELTALRLYAQLYRANRNFSQSRIFYERAIALSRVLGDTQTEETLVNELAQILYKRSNRVSSF